jgi:3-methyladenine DNA glycosylase Mpg
VEPLLFLLSFSLFFFFIKKKKKKKKKTDFVSKQNTMTEELKSMFDLPSASDSTMAESFYKNHLDKLARKMLLDYDLVIGDKRFEMLEVEGYLKAPFHIDPYCHGHIKQKRSCYWFFHHVGMSSGYREGSRKGVDITVGNEDGNSGGMLIRAIRNKTTLIEGPSLVVDAILKEFNQTSVKKFVANRWENIPGLAHDPSSGFYLAPKLSSSDHTVYATPRVGLGLSNKNKSDMHFKFVAKFYRFIVHPELLKKGRALTILAMIETNVPEETMASANKCSVQRIQTYMNTYNLARKDPQKLLKNGLDKDIVKGSAEWRLQVLSAICKLYH